MKLQQYDIVLVNLDPTVGSEIKKPRPCAIISPDDINRQLNTVIIAPITSTSMSYPTRIYTKSLSIPGWIVLDQIRTIDQSRVLKKVGLLTTVEIQKCKAIIEEMLVRWSSYPFPKRNSNYDSARIRVHGQPINKKPHMRRGSIIFVIKFYCFTKETCCCPILST